VNFQAKQLVVAIISLFFLASLLTVGYIESERLLPEKKAKAVVTQKNLSCMKCHEEKSPAVVAQWKDSRHATLGVGCMDCHEAKKGDPDAWEHEESIVAVIPTPKDCARCHEQQVKEFDASTHARAAKSIGELDSFRGVAAGMSEAIGGCQKCHGNKVKKLKDGRLHPATWPNTGIGRINLDGSKGNCASCHSRHQFSVAQARQPESCAKCHTGIVHPQVESYDDSKHGLIYQMRSGEMNLKSQKWVAGKDYSAAPTCATCHMSATKSLPVTHDVGLRVSRALHPVVSTKHKKSDRKRKNMLSACGACHGPDYVKAFFSQADSVLDSYNSKFAAPAEKIMAALKKEGKITPEPFDDKIEWVFFELWHGEGRNPQKVARNFKFDFLGEAERLSPGISGRFVKSQGAEKQAQQAHEHDRTDGESGPVTH
jgi:nitrate/TMAO reductase-like tetraheme cytochrome c subunit